MKGLAHTRVRLATWDAGGPAPTRGVEVHAAAGRVFVPLKDMRRVADRIHDFADELEGEA